MNVDPFARLTPLEMPPDDRFGKPPDGNPYLDTAEPLRQSRFFRASVLAGRIVPPRKWLVPDLVPSKTVTLLGGDGGTGKSLLALQLAHAVATGGRWLGLETETGGALYLSAEDDEEELHRRVADVAGSDLDRLDRLTLRSLAGEDALLAWLDQRGKVLTPAPFLAEIEERIIADRPALVVLDTLADLFPRNENDRAQARQFIGLLRGLAIRHECAVLLLAHPSLSGLNSGSGTSGSTGWNNSVRSRLYLERVVQDGYEPDPDARVLRTMKSNYGRTGAEIALTWRQGVFVAVAPETGLDRMATGMKAERVFLKLLRLMTEQGRQVSAKPSATYAPKVFAAHPDSEGCTKRALATAMEVLLSAGKIAVIEEGPPSKRRSYLEAVE